MSDFIKLTAADDVATVTLDRPDVHNAFNEVVIGQITEAFTALGRDGNVRVVVLAAAGRFFSAGADVKWMRSMVEYSVEENLADAMALANMLRAIRECPKPVIGRVHGAVYGGAVGLVAACDFALAVAEATFALTEVKLGILPAVISPFLQEKMGPGNLRRFALTAERFDAAEARRIGLIAEVVETAAELDERIAFYAGLLKKNGPEAIAACKEILRDIQAVDWETATDRTARCIAQRRVSDEGQEGLRAFLEKRRPAWDAREGD
jgi:methylglutaconyl-CoA hydratase